MDNEVSRLTSREGAILATLALKGDQDALDRLFGSYTPRLYHTALRLLGNAEDAEDALQDGLLSAYRNLKQFQGRSQFSTWLTRIVTNAALMRLRSRRGYVTASIDESDSEPENAITAGAIADHRPNPEETCARQEQFEIIERRLRLLPPTHQSVFRLRDVEGLCTREAAEALGLPEGTLKSRLRRARLKITRGVRKALDAAAPSLPGRAGISYSGNSAVPVEKVLPILDGHDAHSMKVRDLDELVGDALRR